MRAIARDEATERLLSEGDVELLGLMPRASNYTFLVRVRMGQDETHAVRASRTVTATAR